MITISMGDGLAIYTLMTLGVVLLLAVYQAWRDRLHAWNVSEPQLGECAKCGLTFLVRRNENVIRCPRCRAFCSMRRR